MGSSLRYWMSPKAVLDLDEVVGIVETGWVSLGYEYNVAFKSGGSLALRGTGLITQYKKYKETGESNEGQEDGNGATSI